MIYWYFSAITDQTQVWSIKTMYSRTYYANIFRLFRLAFPNCESSKVVMARLLLSYCCLHSRLFYINNNESRYQRTTPFNELTTLVRNLHFFHWGNRNRLLPQYHKWYEIYPSYGPISCLGHLHQFCQLLLHQKLGVLSPDSHQHYFGIGVAVSIGKALLRLRKFTNYERRKCMAMDFIGTIFWVSE